MSIFKDVLAVVLMHEGSHFTDIPEDRGGPTKYGVTQEALSKYRNKPVSAEDVKNLTEAEAAEVFRMNYWNKMNLDLVKRRNIALLIMDMGVLRGVGSVKDVQKILVSMGHNVVIDGRMGPKTAEALNQVNEWQFCRAYLQRCQKHFASIVAQNQTQRKFIMGWINRTHDLWNMVS